MMTKSFTLGVEEEYQIVDPASLELTPQSKQVLQAAEQSLGETVRRELQRSQPPEIQQPPEVQLFRKVELLHAYQSNQPIN